MKKEIGPIRHASRQIVRELHLLDSNLCIDGFSFSACHLLMELDSLGQATASELGERLVLEKSTMSRLVRDLLQRGHVTACRDASDARCRLLSLTAKGRKGLRRLDQHANRQVDDALDCIAPGERQDVVRGLDRYAKALRYAREGHQFRIRPIRQSDNPAVGRIIREVMTEYGAVGCGFSINDAEVEAMYEAYLGPGAAFYVVERKRKVLGCGGMAPLQGGEAGVCELRKMYFLPELRGTGLGTRLLDVILNAARNAGYSLCYLETLENMVHARQLYSRHGFHPVGRALGNTGHSSCNHFMTLKL